MVLCGSVCCDAVVACEMASCCNAALLLWEAGVSSCITCCWGATVVDWVSDLLSGCFAGVWHCLLPVVARSQFLLVSGRHLPGYSPINVWMIQEQCLTMMCLHLLA